uniref:Uncharacterized protein n=1 Tax=Spongospora subterranea TaxID=70186 RepID=A0A0H5REF7_9EUKA|eukprot:CRZ12146.1 hypothetical protein [Spongospora subterranea]
MEPTTKESGVRHLSAMFNQKCAEPSGQQNGDVADAKSEPSTPSVSELRARLSSSIKPNQLAIHRPIHSYKTDQQAPNRLRSLNNSFDFGNGSDGVSSPTAAEDIDKGTDAPSKPFGKVFDNTLQTGMSQEHQHQRTATSVSAIKSQLNLTMPMMQFGGKPYAGKKAASSLDITSRAFTEPNKIAVKNDEDVGMTFASDPALSTLSPAQPHMSKRVSDLQSKLAFNPLMLTPGALNRASSLQSKSTTVPVVPELQPDSQLNRPTISRGSRRGRSVAKFACDQRSSATIDEVAEIAISLGQSSVECAVAIDSNLSISCESIDGPGDTLTNSTMSPIIESSSESTKPDSPNDATGVSTVKKDTDVVQCEASESEKVHESDGDENENVSGVKAELIPSTTSQSDVLDNSQVGTTFVGSEDVSANLSESQSEPANLLVNSVNSPPKPISDPDPSAQTAIAVPQLELNTTVVDTIMVDNANTPIRIEDRNS